LLRRLLTLALLCFVIAALLAGEASADDNVYWTNHGADSLAGAALTGGAGFPIAPTPIVPAAPYGAAYDSATGRVFWANSGADTISSANLDGSAATNLNTAGATVDEPTGVTIDPTAQRIYWANSGADTISWANLDGSGGGNLNTAGAPVDGPRGVVVYPAAGRVYWANFEGDSIGYANLDGSGGGELSIPAEELDGPDAVAIYPGLEEIDWTNAKGPGSIGSANLAFRSGRSFEVSGARPTGIAIDTETNSLYWAASATDAIFTSSLYGSEAKPVDTGAAPVSEPSYPFLISKPQPAVFGPEGGPLPVSQPGAPLECKTRSWEPDVPEAFLYRAPLSFSYRWTVNGVPLGGAEEKTLTPSGTGSFACTVTATNPAGSTSIYAGTFNVQSAPAPAAPTIWVAKLKLDKRHGTATIFARVLVPGTVKLSGAGVISRSAKTAGAGVAKLKVVAKGKAMKALKRTGKARVRVAIGFVTAEGSVATVSRSLTLHLEHRR
jgi:hypothetical protein